MSQLSIFGDASDDPEPKPVYDRPERLQMMVTVKAAPNPSDKNGETVCVAGRLPLHGISHGDGSIRVGALTSMEELTADPVVIDRLPFVREALASREVPFTRP